MKMLVCSMRYEIERDIPAIYLYGRNEDGTRGKVKVKGFKPYFYTTTPNLPDKYPGTLGIYKNTKKTIYGEQAHKVVYRRPDETRRLREEIGNSFESDIPFTDRFRLDAGFRHTIEYSRWKEELTIREIRPSDDVLTISPRIAYLDIETDDREGFPRAEEAKSPVTAVTVADSSSGVAITILLSPGTQYDFKPCKQPYFEEHILRLAKSEAELFEMLRVTLEEILEPDIIAGWNVEEYDILYLKTRATNLGVKGPDWRQFGPFDLMVGFAKLHETELESRSLDFCAQEALGEQKTPKPYGVGEWWQRDTEGFLLYNMRDVWLVKKINEEKGIVDFFLSVSRLSGCPLNKIFFSSKIVDMLFLSKSRDRFCLPTVKRLTDEEYKKNFEEKVKGAYCFDPVCGVFDNVAVFDLASQYPSIMLAFNCSPEMKVSETYDGPKNKMPINDEQTEYIYFRNDKEGILPQMIREMSELRKQNQDKLERLQKGTAEYDSVWERQRANKYIQNSIYGATGFEKFRLADKKLGNGVTCVARIYLKWLRDRVEERGYKVLYGDTDSIFLLNHDPNKPNNFESLTIELNALNNSFAKNIGLIKHYFNIKYEKLFGKWAQTARYVGEEKTGAKQYFGLLSFERGKDLTTLPNERRLEIKGYASRRSDKSLWTRKTVKELLLRILTQPPKEVQEWIVEQYRAIISGKVDTSLLGLPTGLRKDISEYKNNPIQVRAVEYSNKHLGTDFRRDDKGLLYFVRAIVGKPPTDVVLIPWGEKVPDYISVDIKKMVDRSLIYPTQHILKSLYGFEWDAIKKNIRVLDFFA